MAGHSKWANIRHRKEAQDAKRGKIFSRLNKEITVAVKNGGGDPDNNPRLRLAVQNARSQNMPKDNIEKAIKKAMGSTGHHYQEATYEGYGPEGIAIFIEVATDNPTRTVASIRHHLSKHKGSLGKDGCLKFVFERKGVFSLYAKDCGDEESFTEQMIDAGIEEIETENNIITLTTSLQDFGSVQAKLNELNINPIQAGPRRIPTTTKVINPATWEIAKKLLDTLDDDDDVQQVYHNIEYNESFME